MSPSLVRINSANVRLDKSSATIGASGGTLSNAFTNMRVLIAPEALREDALVTLRALSDDETRAFYANYLLLGRGVNASIADARGNLIFDFRAQPMSVCFAYTFAQLAKADGRVENLAIVANLGQPAEAELTLNRVVYPEAQTICADAIETSSWALAAREASASASSFDAVALVRGFANALALVMLVGSALLAALAVFAARRRA